MESNAFKTTAGDPDWRDVTLLCATAAGIVAVAISFLVEPFGRAFVATTWVLVLGGIVLALSGARTRWWGAGFVLAGVALPLAAFCWVWITLSVGVLA